MMTGNPERGRVSGLFRGRGAGGAVGGLEGGGEGGGTETVVDPIFIVSGRGKILGPGCCCFRQPSTLFCLPEKYFVLYFTCGKEKQ